jgi:hypothetical protein
MGTKTEYPFYFLDGEMFVKVINIIGDEAIIVNPHDDVPVKDIVKLNRLLPDKKGDKYFEEDLTIFISGPVTSKGSEQAIKDFKITEGILNTGKYRKVVNVFDLVEVLPDKTWKEYMIETYSIFLDCNAVYMQKGWIESKGARIEHSIAKIMGYIIFYER